MSEPLICPPIGCGTGTWDGPKPGDPNMDSVTLQATPIHGGVELRWSYPSINPAAVAYTEVYRAITNDFSTAIQRVIVSSSNYKDTTSDTTKTYYYWIRMVSIYGTEGVYIGPASAKPLSRADGIRDDLSGEVGVDLLDPWLREEIDRIAITYGELQAEILARANDSEALAEALASMGENFEGSLTVIDTRVSSIQDGQTAIATRQDTLAAANADNLAAILTLETAMVDADSALSNRIDSVNALASNAAAAVVTETTARVNADTAIASQITSINTALGNNAAAISNEISARTSADNALASNISTVQSTLNGQVASVQNILETEIDNLTGEVRTIWGAKVNANGLIGGFTLSNVPAGGVAAGFDVDYFYLGRGVNGIYPFQMKTVGGVPTVFMKTAIIEDLTVGETKIANGAITNINANSALGGDVDKWGGAFNAVVVNVPSGSQTVIISSGFSIELHPSDVATYAHAGIEVWVTRSDSTQIGGSNGVLRARVLAGQNSNITITACDTSPIAGSITYYISVRAQEYINGAPRIRCGPSVVWAQVAKK